MPSAEPSLDRFQRRCGTVLLALLALALLGVAWRIVHINTEYRDRLLSIVERQHEGQSIIPARRGMILDARGRVIAVSASVPDVFIDPALSNDWEALAAQLSPRINVSPEEILERIHRRPDSRYVVVATEVDEVTAAAVRELKDKAVGLTERVVRSYPLRSSMAHIVGFVGRDQAGQEGVERALDEHLRGTDGRRVTIRDARRRALRPAATTANSHRPVTGTSTLGEASSSAPIDGGHIVLTIDAEIQRITEAALATTVVQFDAESGIAVVMSPKNGDVMAMAVYPAFDPNHPGDFPPDVRRNKAITDPTEPGSTFKPVIVAGALDAAIVSATEKIDCENGSHRFGRRLITDTKPRGLLDLRGIITYSSNIGMGKIAERMGNPRLHETIRRFGFGEKTGVDLPGESEGLVYPLRKWTSYSTTSVCIGYEIGVTPLQLINAFAAIANDGLLMRPRIVRSLLSPDGREMERHEEPEVIRRAALPETARFIAQDLLVSVVENGSGSAAKVGRYKVLGKTGTAKLPYRDRPGYEPGQYTSAFMGAAPAHDPQIVTLVMVRRPSAQKGYYGREVAAPTAGKIIAETLAYLQVPPDDSVTLAGGR
jgi:cell division protein FtsI (penicillin-binding protein 3)